MNILVVDDSSLAVSLRALLCASGHNVKVAATVTLAVHYLVLGKFDAVLLDLGLPDSHHYGGNKGLVTAIRACHTKRIILISGAERSVQESLASTVAAEILTKPFDFPSLESLLRENT